MDDTSILPDIPDEVPLSEYTKYWLPAGAYDVLKWAGLLVIPAIATAYSGLAAVWGWPYSGEIAQTAAIISTAIGAVLGASEATKTKVRL